MKSTTTRSLRARPAARAWQKFEDFVTRVVARYYANYDIRMLATPYQHDRGRDAEVTHIFAASKKTGGRELGLSFTIWVEVKSRGKRNVDLQDIGKNLVLALNADVAKIIVVTNRGFSSGLAQHIEDFCRHSRVSCTLIDGPKLSSLAHEIGVTQVPALVREMTKNVQVRVPRRKAAQLVIDLNLTRDPTLLEPIRPRAPIQCDPGTALFISADVSLENGTTAVDTDLSIVPRKADMGEVYRYGFPPLAPLDTDERRRETFVFFTGRSPSALASDFDVRVGPARLRTRIRAAGACDPHIPILSDWTPPSKRKLIERIDQSIRRWLEQGRALAHLMVAAAGTGKSHAVATLRKTWISGGALEIAFNGESHRSDAEVMERAFQQLFPLPPHLLLEDQTDSIQEWLVRAGVAPAAAEHLAKAVCRERSFKPAEFDSDTLGQVLSALLRVASGHAPVIVLFEDLHKAHASALTLFEKTRLRLSTSDDARVCLIATTRYDPTGDPTSADSWFAGYTTLMNSEGFSVTHLKSLTDYEATELITRTVPSLEPQHARAIVKQIGRTPFGIREGINYLAGEGIMIRDSPDDEWRIPQPELLRRAIRLKDFEDATARRINALLRGRPLIRDFLQAAACIGSRFPLDVCVAASGLTATAGLRAELAEFVCADIIRPVEDNDRDYRYDHDLVRVAVLQMMDSPQQTNIAGRVLEAWPHLDDYRAGLLAYQARRGAECVERLRRYASVSRAKSHHVEAVRALRMAIYCVDPEDAPRYAGAGEEDFLLSFDEAVQAAGSVRMAGLTDEQRHVLVLDLLTPMVASLVEVGSSGSELVGSAVTEGEFIAARYGNPTTVALFEAFAGRAAFGRGQFVQAIKHHKRSDAIYGMTPEVDPSLRIENLIRLAIAMRQNGDREESFDVLRQAESIRDPEDFNAEMKVLANAGAVYFYSDHDALRDYWSRSLEAATRSGKPERIAHALIDLVQIDLFDDDRCAARERLDAALRLAEKYGLEDSKLRILLNGGCLDLINGALEVARRKFVRAELMAVSMGAFRRLWRVRANLGTVYDMLGKPVASLNADESATAGAKRLIEYYRKPGGFRFYSREALPFANLVLRARNSSRHTALIETFDPDLRAVGTLLAELALSGQLDRMPSRLGAHCKLIRGGYWFIVTE